MTAHRKGRGSSITSPANTLALVLLVFLSASLAQSMPERSWSARLFAGLALPHTRDAGEWGDRDYTTGGVIGSEMRYDVTSFFSGEAGASFGFFGVSGQDTGGSPPGDYYYTDFSSTMLNIYGGPRIGLGPVHAAIHAGYYSTRDRWRSVFPGGYSTQVYGDDMFGLQLCAGFRFALLAQPLTADARLHWLRLESYMLLFTLGLEVFD